MAQLMALVLRIEDLRKSFPAPRSLGARFRAPFRRDDKLVLDGCSLAIASGEKAALIGPNGAGKTTLARIICGTVLRDRGEVEIDALEAGCLSARGRVALARPDDPALHPRLTAVEALRFHSILYGLTGLHAKALAPIIDALDLGSLMGQRIATLSAGEKAKVSLVKALMGWPSLLILDELSRVLDPKAAERVRNLIDARCQDGIAALLITHDLEEARRCQRVFVMGQGRILASGSWDAVRGVACALFDLSSQKNPE